MLTLSNNHVPRLFSKQYILCMTMVIELVSTHPIAEGTAAAKCIKKTFVNFMQKKFSFRSFFVVDIIYIIINCTDVKIQNYLLFYLLWDQ
jgi:phage-related holin